jgi:hypothetical protein
MRVAHPYPSDGDEFLADIKQRRMPLPKEEHHSLEINFLEFYGVH